MYMHECLTCGKTYTNYQNIALWLAMTGQLARKPKEIPNRRQNREK